MFFNFLLKLAEEMLNQILGEVTKLMNRVQQEVIGEMTRIITQGFDDVWRGEDADAFKQKVQKAAVPPATNMVQYVGKLFQGVQRAAELIKRADTQASAVVDDLVGIISRI